MYHIPSGFSYSVKNICFRIYELAVVTHLDNIYVKTAVLNFFILTYLVYLYHEFKNENVRSIFLHKVQTNSRSYFFVDL
ncbi:hypothetical protein NQ314_015126 [Rhamnusium bicolor]|uniref:Uncharacterized protein n=1 Tax=Rhamnusium bicolor TaxID=1586634 RepID=A0AAV8WYX5_9CUCU|nr:hypothetical protein NQ314_015126 [Rhamnusium bicolor]